MKIVEYEKNDKLEITVCLSGDDLIRMLKNGAIVEGKVAVVYESAEEQMKSVERRKDNQRK